MNQYIQLTGSGVKRRELDFYPTPPEVTHALMKFLIERGLIDGKTSIWEPACGNGAMSEVMHQYVDNVVSTDIRHTGYGTGGVDFLSENRIFDAIITNPPFVLSEAFIKHSLSQAKLVAMVLKSQYWHASKRLTLFDKHPPAFVLALTWRPDFLFDQRIDGKRAAPTMECIWTVWIEGVRNTQYGLLQKGAAA